MAQNKEEDDDEKKLVAVINTDYYASLIIWTLPYFNGIQDDETGEITCVKKIEAQSLNATDEELKELKDITNKIYEWFKLKKQATLLDVEFNVIVKKKE